MRPLEWPIVVLDAADAAVWRMGEGLVGCGVRFGRETMDEGFEKGRGFLLAGFWASTAAVGLGSDSAAAADLELIVEAPLDWTGFLVGGSFGFGLAESSAMVF